MKFNCNTCGYISGIEEKFGQERVEEHSLPEKAEEMSDIDLAITYGMSYLETEFGIQTTQDEDLIREALGSLTTKKRLSKISEWREQQRQHREDEKETAKNNLDDFKDAANTYSISEEGNVLALSVEVSETNERVADGRTEYECPDCGEVLATIE